MVSFLVVLICIVLPVYGDVPYFLSFKPYLGIKITSLCRLIIVYGFYLPALPKFQAFLPLGRPVVS